MKENRTLSHDAAWRGDELLQRPEWQHQLDDVEIAELGRLDLSFVIEPDGSVSKNDAAAEKPAIGDSDLPRITKRLKTIQQQLEHGAGAIRLRGLPVNSLNEAQSRAVFWTLSTHIGVPVSQSAKGERLFSVRDEGFADNDPRSRGPNTRKRLSFHTDRCDVIGFLCLQAASEGGENEVVSSMTLYNEILDRRPDLIPILAEPYYYQRHTVDSGNEKPWCQQPIFSFQDGHFACSFLRVLIERAHRDPELPELSARQIEALDFLEELAADPQMHVRFNQKPGDILFLNNWVTLHRRTAFIDHSDASQKRHILRVWLSPPNNRPLHPLFEDNYGSTEAGSVRGGMKPLA